MSDKELLENIQAELKFQLPVEDFEILRSQFVTSSWGDRRYLMQYELLSLLAGDSGFFITGFNYGKSALIKSQAAGGQG